jgi:hypothetical protein
MTLPYSDPSNPALPSPLFSDVTAVRNDHMRANNAAIFSDLQFLDENNPALVALSSGSFKTAALANADTYNGRSLFTCTAGVSDTPYAGVWRIASTWNPADSSGRFIAMLDASLETWEINYAASAWGEWTQYVDSYGNHCANAFIGGYNSTATSGGTLTLTVASAQNQIFTGTSSHTIVLPVVSTLRPGRTFAVTNNSTGVITVNSSGGNLIAYVPPLTTQQFVCVLITGTDASSWFGGSNEYDLVIRTQADFNYAFERLGANDYQFRSEYKSILVKNATGGFSVSGMLSGGDTWGNIKTNACAHLQFENGATFNFGDNPGAIIANTDSGLLRNALVKGTGSIAAAVTESFLLAAARVTFDNCVCSTRLSNVDMIGFRGSATASHNHMSKYSNCVARALSGTDAVYGFHSCLQLNNCIAYDLNSSGGADNCNGFYFCWQLSGCHANSIDSASSSAYGFNDCEQISACVAIKIDSVSGDAFGFYGCRQTSACRTTDVDSVSGDAHGFCNCDRISACYSNDIDSTSSNAYGFRACTYGAALYTTEPANPSNDWIDTVDGAVANKVSTPSVWT